MTASNPQIDGLDEVGGTYLFDLRTCNRVLAANRFFWNLIRPEARARFLEDEEAAMTAGGLSDAEKDLVRARDWIGLVRHGVNFFALEKLARVIRISNLEVYASMRGETLEQYMQTRRVPEAR